MVTPEMLDKLKIGMTTNQVRFVLGSPQLTDPFHPNRWDYIYSLRENGVETKHKHLILYFENETLSKIEQEAASPAN